MTLPEPSADPSSQAPWEALRATEPTSFVIVLRFDVPGSSSSETVGSQRRRLAAVLDVLSGCAGFRGGWVGRAVDPVDGGAADRWLLVQHWRSVGEYRHALSSVDVRMAVLPVLSTAVDEPSAFEVLHGHSGADATDAPWGVAGPSTSARAPT